MIQYRGLSEENNMRDIATSRGLTSEQPVRKRFIQNRGLDVGTWFAPVQTGITTVDSIDADTVYIKITVSAVESADYVDANAVPITITPSVTENREITDTGTVYLTITPSAVEGKETTDAATVYVKITPSVVEEIYPGSRFFDGVDDRIVLNNESVYDFERTTPHTILTRTLIRTAAASGLFPPIISKQDATNNRGWRLDTAAGATGRIVRVNLRNQFGNQIVVITNAEVSLNAWHSIGYTYDGSSTAAGVQIIVDSAVVADTDSIDTLSATMLNDENVTIASDKATQYFNSNIHYIAIWSVVLNSTEIAQYNAGGDLPRQDALISFFRLSDGQSPELDDKGAASGTVTGTIFDDNDGDPIFFNALLTGFIDSNTVRINITPSGVENRESTDAGTVYVDIQASSTDVEDTVDSNTVRITITPSASEARESTDSGTVPITITPSASDIAAFVDSGTVYVDIDASGTDSMSGASADAATVPIAITPSSTQTFDAVDANTVVVLITPSAVENAQRVDSATVPLTITPSSVDTAQFVDSGSVYVDIQASATEDTAITDAASVYIDISATSTDSAQYVDSGTVPLTITPSSVETAQRVDTTTAYITITPSSSEQYFSASNVDSALVYIKITPSTLLEQYVFFDTLFTATISRRWGSAVEARRWGASASTRWTGTMAVRRWSAGLGARNWVATSMSRWASTIGRK